jgi:hypothetical protein
MPLASGIIKDENSTWRAGKRTSSPPLTPVFHPSPQGRIHIIPATLGTGFRWYGVYRISALFFLLAGVLPFFLLQPGELLLQAFDLLLYLCLLGFPDLSFILYR